MSDALAVLQLLAVFRRWSVSVCVSNKCISLSVRVSKNVTSNLPGCSQLSTLLRRSLLGELANSSKGVESNLLSHGESITKVVTKICAYLRHVAVERVLIN